jgi:ABC-type uncharacterized transport system ATPase subunit
MSEPVLRLSGITRRFGALVANDAISLELSAGEILALLGENGAGKSTLVSILFGHYVADEGSIEAFGAPLVPGDPAAALAAGIGMVHQHSTLADNLSVLDNVRLPCRFSARRAARCTGGVDAAARRLLASMELPETLWLQPAARLSVGQQQRVAAARALIGAPALVLADEPTSALDAALRDGFMAHLLEQVQAAGSTLIFVSHDERLATRFSRRLALPELNRAARVPA